MAAGKDDSVKELADFTKNLSLEEHAESLFDDLNSPAHISRGQGARILNVANQEQFCSAFYHVYKQSKYKNQFEYECLVKQKYTPIGCRITDNAEESLRKQPKDVALLAVLQENGERIWISSFTNCCQCIMYGRKVKKHAEEFLLEDAASNNENSLGSILESFERSDTKSKALTLYITYQPCHKSAENSMEKSCTETVIKLYNEHLKPKGVKLIIKPTHILKAYWKLQKCKSDVENAKEGMRILAKLQIEERREFVVEAMTEDDWQFLADIFNVQLIHIYDEGEAKKDYNYAESERKILDDFINGIVEGFLQEAQE